MTQRLTDEVLDARDAQTVAVPSTGTLDLVIPPLARSFAAEEPRPGPADSAPSHAGCGGDTTRGQPQRMSPVLRR